MFYCLCAYFQYSNKLLREKETSGQGKFNTTDKGVELNEDVEERKQSFNQHLKDYADFLFNLEENSTESEIEFSSLDQISKKIINQSFLNDFVVDPDEEQFKYYLNDRACGCLYAICGPLKVHSKHNRLYIEICNLSLLEPSNQEREKRQGLPRNAQKECLADLSEYLKQLEGKELFKELEVESVDLIECSGKLIEIRCRKKENDS